VAEASAVAERWDHHADAGNRQDAEEAPHAETDEVVGREVDAWVVRLCHPARHMVSFKLAKRWRTLCGSHAWLARALRSSRLALAVATMGAEMLAGYHKSSRALGMLRQSTTARQTADHVRLFRSPTLV